MCGTVVLLFVVSPVPLCNAFRFGILHLLVESSGEAQHRGGRLGEGRRFRVEPCCHVLVEEALVERLLRVGMAAHEVYGHATHGDGHALVVTRAHSGQRVEAIREKVEEMRAVQSGGMSEPHSVEHPVRREGEPGRVGQLVLREVHAVQRGRVVNGGAHRLERSYGRHLRWR